MTTINISEGKKVYFASDNHLGAPTMEKSMPREKKFVAWLDEIKIDAFQTIQQVFFYVK